MEIHANSIKYLPIFPFSIKYQNIAHTLSPTFANSIQLLQPFTIIYIATGPALVRIITIKPAFIMNEKTAARHWNS